MKCIFLSLFLCCVLPLAAIEQATFINVQAQLQVQLKTRALDTESAKTLAFQIIVYVIGQVGCNAHWSLNAGLTVLEKILAGPATDEKTILLHNALRSEIQALTERTEQTLKQLNSFALPEMKGTLLPDNHEMDAQRFLSPAAYALLSNCLPLTSPAPLKTPGAPLAERYFFLLGFRDHRITKKDLYDQMTANDYTNIAHYVRYRMVLLMQYYNALNMLRSNSTTRIIAATSFSFCGTGFSWITYNLYNSVRSVSQFITLFRQLKIVNISNVSAACYQALPVRRFFLSSGLSLGILIPLGYIIQKKLIPHIDASVHLKELLSERLNHEVYLIGSLDCAAEPQLHAALWARIMSLKPSALAA